MIIINDIFTKQLNEGTALTIGKFDGIHRGHKLLCQKISSVDNLKSCIVTFENSPIKTLKDEGAAFLVTNSERIHIIEEEGIDILCMCPFDEKMMTCPARLFVKSLCDNLNMKFMAVGSDFKFGFKGMGDVQLLKELSDEFGFELVVVEKIKKDDRDISSTYIREELKLGHIELVNEMLGYDYFVWNKVVHGAHLGHKIGIPTINLMPPKDKLVPLFGVYVTSIEIDGKIYHGVTNVGKKPTVNDTDQVSIETHILDYDGDLYDQDVKVTFLKFLRAETKFASIDELKEQMNSDKLQARKFFNNSYNVL